MNLMALEHKKNVTAPISMEYLKEYFNNDNIWFHVDYANSKLKDKVLLTYLGNLDIPSDIFFSDAVSKEEKFKVLKEYMTTRSMHSVFSLLYAVGSILTLARGIEEYYDKINNNILTKEEYYEFINENRELVDRWLEVMDSAILYTMSTNNNYVKSCGHPKESYDIIDDPMYISPNFAYMFGLPGFCGVYYTIKGPKYTYFIRQYEEYMFKGQNLYHFFITNSNPLPALFMNMGFSDIDFNKLVDECTKLEKMNVSSD